MSDVTEGLDVIEPAARGVQFRGRQVVVRPLTVGQLPAFARAIRPIIGQLGTLELSVDGLLDLIADHGEHVIEAVAVATGVPADDIRQAGADEMIALVAEVISANRDFLVGRLPTALQAVARAAAPSPGSGQTHSKP